MVIELLFPMNKNLSAGEFGKIANYEYLEIKIEQFRHLKPKLIPFVLGIFGIFKKGKSNI